MRLGRPSSEPGYVTLAFFLLAVIAFAGPATEAPSQAGGIQGTVKDLTDRAVPNAKVTLSRDSGLISPVMATTSAMGSYEIRRLPPGSYDVCVEAAGYRESQRKSILVTSGVVTVVDFTLSPAKSSTRRGPSSGQVFLSACQKRLFDDSGMKAAELTGSGDPSGYSASAGAQTHRSLMEGADDLRKWPQSTSHGATGSSSNDLSEESRYDHGLELLLQGDIASALALLKEGVMLHPKSAKLWIGVGIALYSGGHPEDAVTAFLRATDLNPADPRPYRFLGKAYNVSINATPAVTARLNRWIQLEPRNAEAYYYCALSLWKGNRESGLPQELGKIQSLLEQSVSLDPTFPYAHVQLGNLYFAENRFPDAIAEYQKAARLKPELAEAHYHLGQVLLRTGRKDAGQQQMAIYEQLHEMQSGQALLIEGRRFVESIKGRDDNKHAPP